MRLKDLGTREVPARLRDLASGGVRGHAPAVRVQRREIPYWQERGWNHVGNTYSGNYQTPYAAFCGHIIEHSRNDLEFFLLNPSEQIQGHSHWACFQVRGQGWYFVHMGRRPADVSSGIITIERLISDAYGYEDD